STLNVGWLELGPNSNCCLTGRARPRILVCEQSRRKQCLVSRQGKCSLAFLCCRRSRWLERRARRLQNFARSRAHLVGIPSANEWAWRFASQQTRRVGRMRDSPTALAFRLSKVCLRGALGNMRETFATELSDHRWIEIQPSCFCRCRFE